MSDYGGSTVYPLPNVNLQYDITLLEISEEMR